MLKINIYILNKKVSLKIYNNSIKKNILIRLLILLKQLYILKLLSLRINIALYKLCSILIMKKICLENNGLKR